MNKEKLIQEIYSFNIKPSIEISIDTDIFLLKLELELIKQKFIEIQDKNFFNDCIKLYQSGISISRVSGSSA